MGWKKKTCIAAAMILLCGADATVMAQENAAATMQTQEDRKDFVQKGLAKVEALLRQRNYAEAEEKCRNLVEYEQSQNVLNCDTLHMMGNIYRIEEKHSEEIALWKGVFEKQAQIFKVNNTQVLLRPIAELCAAYQAAGDFVSTEPYLRHGEKIVREHAGKNLEEYEKDKQLFQTSALFNRIGQGTITPAEASKEAKALLEIHFRQKDVKAEVRECSWLEYYEWCEPELIDIVFSAVAVPHTFSEDVADFRRRDDAVTILRDADREETMWCMGRAAYTYVWVLGRNKDADRMLAPLYQEVKQEYRRPHTQQEAEAMMCVLSVKGVLSTLNGDHEEAIAATDIAWELYEDTSKSKDVQDGLIGLSLTAVQSYKAMEGQEKGKTVLARMAQISDSGSFAACCGKVLQTFDRKDASAAEKRQALRELRAAADRECAEDPNQEIRIRKTMQILTEAIPEKWASVIRSEQDTSIGQEGQIFGEQSFMARFELFATVEKAFNRKEYLKAISLYERFLELSRAAGDDYGEMTIQAAKRLARSYYLAGCQAEQEGNKENANTLKKRGFDYYKEMIDLREKQREQFGGLSQEERGTWFANVVADYMDAAVSLPSKDAFDVLEKCKARILLERFAEQAADASGILTAEESEKLQAYQQETRNRREAVTRLEDARRENEVLQNARKEWKRAVNDEQEYREVLRQKHPVYRELSKPTILTGEEGKQLFPPDTAFFEYVLRKSPDYPRYIYTDMLDEYSLTKTGVDYIGYGDGYWDEWFAYYKVLSYPNFESFSKVYRLWKIEEQGHISEHYLVQEKGEGIPPNVKERIDSPHGFEEARKEMAEKWGSHFDFNFTRNLGIQHGMRLLIAPDDSVPILPFETLTCDGKPFAEMYEISYVPSLSVYALMRERGTTNAALADRKGLFAMGNAIYGYTEDENLVKSRGGNFKELPETERELDQVGGLFPEEERIVLQREEASEPQLKSLDQSGDLSQYKYLLFAAHGVFEEDNPMKNAIVLSWPDKRNPAESDGYVTVGEWMGYKLRSDLVYLSACETGRGSKYAGEGLIGLPYALTIAGNKNTIMTLWEIEDEPAAAFSKAFFGRLAAGQTAVQALAATKREFIHHEKAAYRDPHVWGAFQLYGE